MESGGHRCFPVAKIEGIKQKKPLYRGYNRGYIGAIVADCQMVTSIAKYLVYLTGARW